MFRKWLNVFSFFKVNFVINFFVSILALIFVDFNAFTICFLTLGYLICLLLRELYPKRKIEYIFYYNNGLTKSELILYCFLLNILCIILIDLLVFLC